MSAAEPFPPRYFLRRFAAFTIDCLCASVIGSLLALLLSFASSEKVHLSGVLSSGTETCKDYDPIPQVLKDWGGMWEVQRATVCTYRPYYVLPYQRRLTLHRGPAGGDGSAFINTYAVTKHRKIKPLLELDIMLGQFVLLLGSAFCIGRFRTTPGKRLLELRVEGQGCALCRELRRTGVFLLISTLWVIVTGLSHLPQTGGTLVYVTVTEPEQIEWSLWALAIYASFAGLFAWYYINPWLRWRGAMPYDTATGFRITRD